MNIDFQKLGEILNECVNEEMFIRVGRYEGDYHLGSGQFKKIKGELFIKTNSDTIFRVVSDDSSIFDDFDIIGSDAIVTPIDKELENKKNKYESVENWIENLVLPCLNEYCSDEGLVADVYIKEINR